MPQLVRALLLLTACILLQPAMALDNKPMTNQDVINMAKAQLPENTIVMAIQAAKPAFDTSANGLIKLKTAGVPQGVIEAVIAASSQGGSGGATTSGAAPNAARGAFNPEEVMLVDAGVTTPMRYLTPQMRHAARALGWGGVAGYAVLRGPQASLRLKNPQPEFLVAVPANAQAESYYTLVNLAVRNNGTREIMVGGGYMSYSTGVANDRVVRTSSTKLPDQSKAPKDFIIYRVKVDSPLPVGEYAVVLYNSQIRSVGYFSTGLDSYFDFGVD
jgi:hypothetical protein